jgi:hypothetical protein
VLWMLFCFPLCQRQLVLLASDLFNWAGRHWLYLQVHLRLPCGQA